MKSGDPIDELLTGGLLPARAYDDIFERVLATVETRPPRVPSWRRRRWMMVPAGTLAAALGAWLTLYRPERGGFTVKGPGQFAAAVGIAVACGPSAAPRCRTGDTMMFVVSPSSPGGYLIAYAESIDEPNRERIWYFPDSAGTAPHVQAGDSTTVLEQGVKVGPEHRPGRYRIVLATTPTPIQRDVAARELEGAPTTLEIEIAP